MDYNLAIDLIINRQKYSKVYHFSSILFVVILVFTYVIFTYKYQTYYTLKGRVINNEIELFISPEELQTIEKGIDIIIDNEVYSYRISHITIENEYYYLYLQIPNLSHIDNYVYDLKIPKENKTLAKYLKDYL